MRHGIVQVAEELLLQNLMGLNSEHHIRGIWSSSRRVRTTRMIVEGPNMPEASARGPIPTVEVVVRWGGRNAGGPVQFESAEPTDRPCAPAADVVYEVAAHAVRTIAEVDGVTAWHITRDQYRGLIEMMRLLGQRPVLPRGSLE